MRINDQWLDGSPEAYADYVELLRKGDRKSLMEAQMISRRVAADTDELNAIRLAITKVDDPDCIEKDALREKNEQRRSEIESQIASLQHTLKSIDSQQRKLDEQYPPRKYRLACLRDRLAIKSPARDAAMPELQQANLGYLLERPAEPEAEDEPTDDE